MALVNPNIALGIRQPEFTPRNAMAEYAQMQQVMNAQDAQQMNALKMQEARDVMTERNALRQLNPSASNFEDQLFRLNPTLGIQYRKERSAAEASAAATAASRAAAAKSGFDLKSAQRKFGEDLKRGLSANPSDENIIAFGQDAVLQGLYSKDQVEATVGQLLAMPPAERVRVLSQAGASAEALKPNIQQVNQGGQTQVLRVPAFGGQPTVAGTFADVPLPANVQAQKVQSAAAGAAQQTVNAYTPASVEAQKQFVQSATDERKMLRTAPDTLKNIEAAIKIIPSASSFMGKGGEPLLAAASFLNNRLGFGINTQGVTDATVLRTRLFEGILDNLKKLDSQPSQEQQRVLSEALGNLGTDPAALEQILNRIGETVRDRVSRFNDDVTQAETRGVKFPFKPQISLPPPKATPGQIPTGAAPTTAPIYARNPQTNQRIMSTDGGNNWTPAR